MEHQPYSESQMTPKLEEHPTKPDVYSGRVAGCASFDGLYSLIDEMKTVQGSENLFEAPFLKHRIDQVRHGHRELSYVTRTYGLQAAVERLLIDDSTYKKYVLNRKNKS